VAKLPHFYAVTLPHFYATKLPHFYAVTLPHFYAVKLQHFYTVTLQRPTLAAFYERLLLAHVTVTRVQPPRVEAPRKHVTRAPLYATVAELDSIRVA
jgi:hypothetical protein